MGGTPYDLVLTRSLPALLCTLGSSDRGREQEEAAALIQARDDGSLDQSSSTRGGKKWSNFEGH